MLYLYNYVKFTISEDPHPFPFYSVTLNALSLCVSFKPSILNTFLWSTFWHFVTIYSLFLGEQSFRVYLACIHRAMAIQRLLWKLHNIFGDHNTMEQCKINTSSFSHCLLFLHLCGILLLFTFYLEKNIPRASSFSRYYFQNFINNHN